MATILYKGKEYSITCKVQVINQGYGYEFYCYGVHNDLPECLGNKNFIFFRNCYRISRQTINNPLNIMRDFLLVRVPCRIEILEADYKINLDNPETYSGGGMK